MSGSLCEGTQDSLLPSLLLLCPVLQIRKVSFRKLGNLHEVTELLGSQVREGAYEV